MRKGRATARVAPTRFLKICCGGTTRENAVPYGERDEHLRNSGTAETIG